MTINYLLGDLFETNASGTITTSYTDGPAGNLASFNGPPTGTPTYLYYDEQGNLVAEADNSGTLSASHSYDPFGAPKVTSFEPTLAVERRPQPSQVRAPGAVVFDLGVPERGGQRSTSGIT